ncbi:MAG: hypothetical protein M3R53_10345 [Candidatus Eremiobacteraeota bacterium]|nr:hypothetical protein [Candidatus Eremiobacteraeota bacterium]
MPLRHDSKITVRIFPVLLAIALLGNGRIAASQPDESPSPSASAVPSPLPSPSLPPAGVIPAALSLDVTGSPVADSAFLDERIRAELDRQIRPTLRFGAGVSYGPIVPWPLLPLALGTRAAVNVTVTISGSDTGSAVTGVTTVTLNSAAVAPTEPSTLFLSDDPEYLLSEGLVFRGDVDAARPARLYYYHSNIGPPRDLDIVLTSAITARVHLIQSEAGPDLDVMSVGHFVTRDFLQYERANEGTVVNVVPGVPFVVRHAVMLHGELVAGAVDVAIVSGGPVAVSVVASPAGSRPGEYVSGPRVAFDGHHRHGAFALGGYGTIAAAYTVGGPPIAAKFGGRVPTPDNLDPADDGHDYGDYGVIRRITFTLNNPTDDTHRVYLYAKPLGGAMRGSFVVDGQLKEVDCVRVPQQYGIMTYEMPPHSTGASTTDTMTDGGSNYPLEFGVTDTQPLPVAPPAGSAESCRPNTASFPQAALSDSTPPVR